MSTGDTLGRCAANSTTAIGAKKTIIAKCIVVNGSITKVSYLPVWINKQSVPELLSRKDNRSDEVYKYMEWVCQDQGLDTRFAWEGDEVVILAKS